MGYAFLADVIVAIHVAYVSFILVGQLAIVVGLVLRWEWIRNPWFRITHLAAIGIVALESIAGIACPLTVWEDALRSLAGQEVTEGSFIGRELHRLLFYDAEPWFFRWCYVAFALAVLGTFLLAPPRRKGPPVSGAEQETMASAS
jgi:hypothetical protein